MRPKVIAHVTTSVDGAISGFPVDMGLHYGLVGAIAPDIPLVGSLTAKTGTKMFHAEVPPESDGDRPDI